MSEKIAMNRTSNHTVNKGRYTEYCGENPNINNFLRSEAWKVKIGSWEYHHSIRNRKLPLDTDFQLIWSILKKIEKLLFFYKKKLAFAYWFGLAL